MEEVSTLPWDGYFREPLRRGLSHPLRQRECELALRRARASIHLLALATVTPSSRDLPDPGERLVRAVWSGDHASLEVYAVGSDRRATVRALLLNRGLSRVCEWLAAIPGRGNAWQASYHELLACVVGDHLVFEEREGAFWDLVRRS